MDTTNTVVGTQPPRYQQVDNALPKILPPITREEAVKASKRIYRHFGGVQHGSANQLGRIRPYWRNARRVWVSPKPTQGSNHCKGWGRLIHDISHHIFERRHPGFRLHDAGHEVLEREIAEYVVAQGWLHGKLKTPAKVIDQHSLELTRTEAAIKRWESKLQRAVTALRKLKRRQTALLKK